jgi:hypothetical protein
MGCEILWNAERAWVMAKGELGFAITSRML